MVICLFQTPAAKLRKATKGVSLIRKYIEVKSECVLHLESQDTHYFKH